MVRSARRGGWVPALVLGLLACALPRQAHAWTFKPYTVLLSVEGGPHWNMLRLQDGTRRTPHAGVSPGFNVDITLFSPRHSVHRASAVLGLVPDLVADWSLPDLGVRPGLNNPLPNPGVLTNTGTGLTALGGARYRMETAFAFVPFLEVTAFTRLGKLFKPSPLHWNVGLRAGGGIEYYVLHKVALVLGFHVRGGLLLWPLPRVLPVAETTAEVTGGVRFRAF